MSPSLQRTISARNFENINASNIIQSSLEANPRNYTSSINPNSDTFEFGKRNLLDNDSLAYNTQQRIKPSLESE